LDIFGIRKLYLGGCPKNGNFLKKGGSSHYQPIIFFGENILHEDA